VDYIPSRFIVRERMDYGSTQLEMDSLNYLMKCWPGLPSNSFSGSSPYPNGSTPGVNGIDWNGNGTIDAGPVTLEGHQCLVFFLGGIPSNGVLSGFSTNPRNPAMLIAGGTNVGPFFQFKAERISYPPGSSFAVYIDPWKVQPYAYFSSYGKQNGYPRYVSQYGSDCSLLGVSPYKSGVSTYINTNGFQILSAGKDQVFGSGDVNFPPQDSPGGADDLSNFSKSTLENGLSN
jgi:hypothetical protein